MYELCILRSPSVLGVVRTYTTDLINHRFIRTESQLSAPSSGENTEARGYLTGQFAHLHIIHMHLKHHSCSSIYGDNDYNYTQIKL